MHVCVCVHGCELLFRIRTGTTSFKPVWKMEVTQDVNYQKSSLEPTWLRNKQKTHCEQTQKMQNKLRHYIWFSTAGGVLQWAKCP